MAFRKINQSQPSQADPEPPAPAHRIGRPSTYQDIYPEQLTALASAGWSIAELMAHFCHGSLEVWNHWQEANPAFQAAVLRARPLALAWWEKKARKGVESRDFNANLYRIAVAARFPDAGYKDYPQAAIAPAALPIDLSMLSATERETLTHILSKAKHAKVVAEVEASQARKAQRDDQAMTSPSANTATH